MIGIADMVERKRVEKGGKDKVDKLTRHSRRFLQVVHSQLQ